MGRGIRHDQDYCLTTLIDERFLKFTFPYTNRVKKLTYCESFFKQQALKGIFSFIFLNLI